MAAAVHTCHASSPSSPTPATCSSAAPSTTTHACRWVAALGIVLAISRAFITEPGQAFEPELALLEVSAHTHHLPRHWRGRAHTREVQAHFSQLFQFKVRPACCMPPAAACVSMRASVRARVCIWLALLGGAAQCCLGGPAGASCPHCRQAGACSLTSPVWGHGAAEGRDSSSRGMPRSRAQGSRRQRPRAGKGAVELSTHHRAAEGGAELPAAVQALLFLEELTSILLTPFVLWWSLPQCAPAIVAFVRDHTVRVPGVGDVCSLAAFSLPMHGNPKYGSPYKAAKVSRSSVSLGA